MPIDCLLEYSIVGEDGEHQGTVVNLSHNGILFTTDEPLDVGRLLSIVLTAGDVTAPPLRATVKVTRLTDNGVNYEVACIIRRQFD